MSFSADARATQDSTRSARDNETHGPRWQPERTCKRMLARALGFGVALAGLAGIVLLTYGWIAEALAMAGGSPAMLEEWFGLRSVEIVLDETCGEDVEKGTEVFYAGIPVGLVTGTRWPDHHPGQAPRSPSVSPRGKDFQGRPSLIVLGAVRGDTPLNESTYAVVDRMPATGRLLIDLITPRHEQASSGVVGVVPARGGLYLGVMGHWVDVAVFLRDASVPREGETQGWLHWRETLADSEQRALRISASLHKLSSSLAPEGITLCSIQEAIAAIGRLQRKPARLGIPAPSPDWIASLDASLRALAQEASRIRDRRVRSLPDDAENARLDVAESLERFARSLQRIDRSLKEVQDQSH